MTFSITTGRPPRKFDRKSLDNSLDRRNPGGRSHTPRGWVMAMKVGIAGFAGSGKSTVFEWLTGVKPDPSKVQSGQTGHAPVPDVRLDWLFGHFKPKRNEPVYASIDFLDTPGLLHEERRDNPRRLSIMREAGGLLVVLTGFGD